MRPALKKILSLILTLALLAGILPTAAFAGLLENEPEKNEEILSALKAVAGSDEEAEEYYAVLEQYGLLDEDGSLVQDKKVEIDGSEYDLDGLRELLAGDYDPEQLAFVDDTPVTLGNLKTILDIEDYIAYLRENFILPEDWSEEQEENFADLVTQMLDGNVDLTMATVPAYKGEYSGLNHGAVVSFDTVEVGLQNKSGTVRATLSGAEPGQTVSFSYSFVSATAVSTDTLTKTATLTAGEDGKAEAYFYFTTDRISVDTFYSDAAPRLYLCAQNLKNALFANGGTATSHTVEMRSTAPSLPETYDFSFDVAVSYNDFWGTREDFDFSGTEHELPLSRGWLNEAWMTEFATVENEGGVGFELDANLSFDFYSTDPANGNSTKQNILHANVWNPGMEDQVLAAGQFSAAIEEPGTSYCAEYWYEAYAAAEDELVETITIGFRDTAEPTCLSASCAAGSYSAGQYIPVVVSFSEAVKPAGATAVINGLTLTAEESGEGSQADKLTFLYPAEAMRKYNNIQITELSAVDPVGNELTGFSTLTLGGVTVTEPEKLESFTGATASLDESDPAQPCLNVSLSIADDNGLVTWLAGDLDEKGVSQSLTAVVSEDEKASFKLVGETIRGGTLTASIPLKRTSSDRECTVELYDGDSVVMGFLDRFTLKAVKYITEENITTTLVVKDAEGGIYSYEDPDEPVVFVQDAPQISARFELDAEDYTFGDTESITYFEGDTPKDADALFAWKSSDPEIATVDETGTVTPTGKTGTVKFLLYVMNDGTKAKQVMAATEEIRFDVGLTPFLLMPNHELVSTGGKDVNVYWSSNIPDKEKDTVFTFAVKRGEETVWTTETEGFSVSIPGEYLAYSYETEAANSLTLEVGTQYQDVPYSAAGTLMLLSAPAQVSLSHPESSYLTDAVGSVSLSYLVSSFDAADAGETELFKLVVTRGSETVLEQTEPASGAGGSYSGTVNIDIADVIATTEDPASYRDVYTVTLQARNGTDSSWSADSYVFYVYDTEALKLLINGEEAEDTTLISNVSAISAMTQEEILALDRMITLEDSLSINYEDYAWTDLSDRTAWSSSDSNVADVRYVNGASQTSIESLSYTSYLPVSDFVLAGVNDGTADIRVTHVLTGLTADTELTVETLQNKLYLFACTPAAETTLSYTNGNNEHRTVVSDENGRAAVYEESGIASDVFFTCEYDGAHYAGTLRCNSLASGEGRGNDYTGLYPCNNLTLRRVAYAYMYLKDTDGTPYTDDVILRGGVYVNGSYIEDAFFGYGENADVECCGEEDYVVTPDELGRITITMDSTQWGLEGGLPTAEDEIEYVFEISPAEGTAYYPLFVSIDAGLNEEEYVQSGDAIVSMRKNSSEKKAPFIVAQSAELINTPNNISVDVDLLDSTARIGISDLITDCELTFDILWWGESEAPVISGSLDTADEKRLGSFEGQTGTRRYPFAHSDVTTIRFHIDKAVAEAAGLGADPLGLRLNWQQGENVSVSHELSFTLANSIGQAADIQAQGAEMARLIMESLTGISSEEAGEDVEIGDSWLMNLALKLFGKNYSVDKKDTFGLSVTGTADPNVYYMYISAGIGKGMQSNNATGIYAFDPENSERQFLKVTPELPEAVLLFTRDICSYSNKYSKIFNKAFDGKAVLTPVFKVYGNLELKVSYGTDHKWHTEVINGGFIAGGGVEVAWYANTFIGPIPVTFEVGGGGTGEVSMEALTMQYIRENGVTGSGTEFLSQLRVYLYVKAFGGIGFDASIIALKIGVFGQINFDFTAQWLNRPYFYEDESPASYYDGEPITDTDGKHSGQYLILSGMIGIEFVAKLLFLKYEKVLCSLPFEIEHWDYNNWYLVNDLWDKSKEKNRAYINQMIKSGDATLQTIDGQSYLAIDYLPVTESFAYLDGATPRSWNNGTLANPTENAGKFTVMQSNAYPFSEPVLSDDGAVVVYLSDSNGETGSVQTAYALRSGDGYTDMGLIAGDDTEDTGCVVAGGGSFAVAAWSSLGAAPEKDAGSVITPEEQMIMTEGSEISVAVYEGGVWTPVALTDNSCADLAPVVAVSGDRAIVAWRSVATGHLDGNLADFNLKDEIHYSIYEGGSWSEERTLYNGTAGNVKGLNAAMLSDGTAAVIYSLDKDGNDSTSADREIQWTVIAPDGLDMRSVQASSDEVADENPQITSLWLGESESFVAAWNSNQNESGDVRIADFGADGVMTLRLPQTVSSATPDSSLSIGVNFRIAKGADGLDELALVWSEANAAETEDAEPGDSLKAVCFYTRDNGSIGISAPQTLATAGDSTGIDYFDSCVVNGDIIGLCVCTEYDTDAYEELSGTTSSGLEVDTLVTASESFMATTVGSFSDGFCVNDVSYDDESLRCGSDTSAAFAVKNTGVSIITKLEIELGDSYTLLEGLALEPGQTGTFYADYSVPADTLRDEDYTVTAYTGSGPVSASGTVPFGRAGVAVVSAETVEVGNGKRTVEVKLCDTTDFALPGSSVVLSFSTDPDGESILKSYLITDSASLELIDKGAFSLQQSFDLSELLSSESGEIPEEGIEIYVSADVLNAAGESINLGGRSIASLILENLVTKTGKDVSLNTELRIEDGRSYAHISARNNHLSQTQTGNLIVSLLDGDGKILAQQQSLDPTAAGYGLLTIGGEETVEADFVFEQEGASLDVQLESFALDETDSGLALFRVTNIPEISLDSFTRKNDGELELTVATEGLESLSVVLMPESIAASVSCGGEPVNGTVTLAVEPGTNTYTFRVSSGDGKSVTDYTLIVQNSYVCQSLEPVQEPEDGVFYLRVGEESFGSYGFCKVGKGWYISRGSLYAAVIDGELSFAETPFLWYYEEETGSFYFTESVTEEREVLRLFTVEQNTELRRYFSPDGISDKPVTLELLRDRYSMEHTWNGLHDREDGSHGHECVYCGEEEHFDHSFDRDGRCECGLYDPEMQIPTHTVSFVFVSGTEGRELPDAVRKLLPAAYKAYEGDEVEAKAGFDDVKTPEGTWEFKGWKPKTQTMETEDLRFTGAWVLHEPARGALTGDGAHPALWASLAAACLLTALACYASGKRRKGSGRHEKA